MIYFLFVGTEKISERDLAKMINERELDKAAGKVKMQEFYEKVIECDCKVLLT